MHLIVGEIFSYEKNLETQLFEFSKISELYFLKLSVDVAAFLYKFDLKQNVYN